MNGRGEYGGGPGVEDAADLPGVPDAFQRLWTPHRLAYISLGYDGRAAHGCAFCLAPEGADADGLIVTRGHSCYVLLNLYPYNTGHLLICPYRHIPTYDLATAAEVNEIATLTQTAMRVLQATSRCEGFNIGMNQGRVAGAGIDEHLHQHVVPRWANDANFFPIIAQTKALSRLLEDVRSELQAAWPPQPPQPPPEVTG